MHIALTTFARAERIERKKHVVVDGAPWQRTPTLRLTPGLHLEFLPPCPPELQPAERLWPTLNEGLANRLFPSIHALDRVLVRRCRPLLAHPKFVRALTAYHWEPSG